MIDIERLLRESKESYLELKNQIVDYRKNGKRKRNSRTVYDVRLDYDGLTIIGDIRLRNPDETHTVTFDPDKECWRVEGETVSELQDRARLNGLRSISQRDLVRLHESHNARSIRRYAVAIEAKRRGHSKLSALADMAVRCPVCRESFEVASPGYLYKTLKTFCDNCQRNVEIRKLAQKLQATDERDQRIHELEKTKGN